MGSIWGTCAHGFGGNPVHRPDQAKRTVGIRPEHLRGNGSVDVGARTVRQALPRRCLLSVCNPFDPSHVTPASTAELSRTEIKHIWERGHGAERGRNPPRLSDERLRPRAD